MTRYPTIFAFFLLCSVIFTWPLAIELTSSLPQGTESAGTVPLFNLWTLNWNLHSITNFYQNYWNSPIFHPEKGTFALSEPQPITGMIFTLFYLISQSDVAAYNLLIILFLALNALSATYLLREWNVSNGPAIIAGVMMLAIPFVSNEIGVIQLTPVFPFIMAVALFYKVCKDPSRKNSVLFGLSFTATVLFSTYYGIYLSLFLLVGAAFFFRPSVLNKETLINLLIGASVSILTLLPTVSKQLEMSSNYSRSTISIKRTSAHFIDYLRLHPNHWGQDIAPWLEWEKTNFQKLYPGTFYILLAVLALIIARKIIPKDAYRYCFTSVAIAFFLSIGLNLEIFEIQPYEYIRQNYPGLKQLRSPFRFSVVLQIFLTILAGVTFERLWRWKQPASIYASILIAAIAISEVMIAPIKLYEMPKDLYDKPWIQALKEAEPGPVAMIPFPKSGRARDYDITTINMLQALKHEHPIINGYSGYYPKVYTKLLPVMSKFPANNAIAKLRKTGTRYIVINWEWMESYRGNIYSHLRNYKMVHSGPEVIIYDIS